MRTKKKSTFPVKCPLTDGIIDSDLCLDVQDCIGGYLPVTIEFEDFLDKEDYEEICAQCKYHL